GRSTAIGGIRAGVLRLEHGRSHNSWRARRLARRPPERLDWPRAGPPTYRCGRRWPRLDWLDRPGVVQDALDDCTVGRHRWRAGSASTSHLAGSNACGPSTARSSRPVPRVTGAPPNGRLELDGRWEPGR